MLRIMPLLTEAGQRHMLATSTQVKLTVFMLLSFITLPSPFAVVHDKAQYS